jgi:penicillin-binding protein 1B
MSVIDAKGLTVWDNPVSPRRVLDSRVSYLMVSLMESVINNGTGAGVRSRGFRLPAAGKTGTSHDGWFAGFTSNLLAVAWVGYDDDRDLNITGSQSALPIWTEFMKRSSGMSLYSSALPFNKPFGIETAAIDNLTNLVAAADPILTHSEVFIAGTEPLAPVPGEPGTAALEIQPQLNPSLAEKESPQTTGNIVLISNPQGRKVYINGGMPFSADPNPASRPPSPSPPSAP